MRSRRAVLRGIGASGVAVTAFSGPGSATILGEDTFNLRVVNAIPDGPPFDLYLNGGAITENIGYQTVTDYRELSLTEYEVAFVPDGGDPSNPLATTTLDPEGGTDYTVGAVGTHDSAEAVTLVDDNSFTLGPEVRVVNFSPDTQAIDVVTTDGPFVFGEDLPVQGLSFGSVSDYLEPLSGTYQGEVIEATTGLTLDTYEVTLDKGGVYSLVAFGFQDPPSGDPGFEARLVTDSPPF